MRNRTSKGILLPIPTSSKEIFLSCFKESNVDMKRLKELASTHKEVKNKNKKNNKPV